MMSLVEREYGEKGIRVMPDPKRRLTSDGGIPVEVSKFPRVVNMLKSCEKKVAEMSEKSGLPMKILFDGAMN